MRPLIFASEEQPSTPTSAAGGAGSSVLGGAYKYVDATTPLPSTRKPKADDGTEKRTLLADQTYCGC